MPAAIENMLYTGRTPWHGLGTYVGDEPILSDDALVLSGLDWEVSTEPLFHEHPGDGLFHEVGSHRCVRRSSDQKVLGVVGDAYTTIQNRDAFAFLDGLVESGNVRYHTAGSLRGGRWVWMLAQLPGAYEVVRGDAVVPYMLALTSHDGSLALFAFPTVVRVVCANTAKAALSARDGAGVKIRHTANAETRMKQAQKALRETHVRVERFRAFTEAIARVQINQDRELTFFNELLGIEGDDDASTQAKNQREALQKLFEAGTGQDIPGVAGTGWALYNAVTEYANYDRSTRGGDPNLNGQDKRFESAITGSGSKLVTSAVEILSGWV
tara:strand:+ start:3363 stop:4340 length:978 start_codon:yes stop_codon:yes gene_type:complete